jgi:hypothetical protein
MEEIDKEFNEKKELLKTEIIDKKYDLDKFIQFCDIIWGILGKNWALKHGVIEQGVVNYLIYYEKLFNECLVKSDNENGRVITIGLTDRKNIFLDSQNNILNR